MHCAPGTLRVLRSAVSQRPALDLGLELQARIGRVSLFAALDRETIVQVGKRLRQLRQRAGLTAREVAEGVIARGLASSEQQITSYERGQHMPGADKAEAIQAVIAQALGAREMARGRILADMLERPHGANIRSWQQAHGARAAAVEKVRETQA